MPGQQLKSRHSPSLKINLIIISSNSCSIFIPWPKKLHSMQFKWEIYQTGGWKWKPCLLSLSIFIRARSFASALSFILSTRRAFIVYWQQPYEPLGLREAFAKGSALGHPALLQCSVRGRSTSGTATLWGQYPGDWFRLTSQTTVAVSQPGSTLFNRNYIQPEYGSIETHGR